MTVKTIFTAHVWYILVLCVFFLLFFRAGCVFKCLGEEKSHTRFAAKGQAGLVPPFRVEHSNNWIAPGGQWVNDWQKSKFSAKLPDHAHVRKCWRMM